MTTLIDNQDIAIDPYEAEFLPRVEKSHAPPSYPRVAPLMDNMRTIDESQLPYKCGIIFFYHIACTGGASLNWWLGKEKDINNATYMTDWGRHDGVEPRFIGKMNDYIKDLGPTQWKVAHAHGFSFFTNTSEPMLYKWREEVESQGCHFIAATMLRDAVGHTISQSKTNYKSNKTWSEWITHLEPENSDERGIFNTQIDYLLYNRGPRNEFHATKEEKVRRAMELLQRHFDIVLLSDYDKFAQIILKITGWKGIDVRHHNSFNGELEYTEMELDKIRRLTVANGDVQFIDAVKHVYYGYLDYLVE